MLVLSVAAASCRHHGRRCLSYSRMLDMGGAPSSRNDRSSGKTINTSKNSKVQAVCFDFETLTRSIVKDDATAADESSSAPNISQQLGAVQPNVGMVQQVADLLSVSLGGSERSSNKTAPQDDLSRLTGEAPEKKKSNNPLLQSDVRSKYADKLAQKGIGGLAGVERAKQQVHETLQKGDAAGHLAARKMVASEPVARKDKWMALTGTGDLLQYLSERSMKLCLLPHPTQSTEDEGHHMEQLERQLTNVAFHSLIKGGDGATEVVKKALTDLDMGSPLKVMLVSDRDEYIRAAKDSGMVTCRIRPPNTRRGNVSAHYMVGSVPEVKDVVNEINGISFNAVLKGR